MARKANSSKLKILRTLLVTFALLLLSLHVIFVTADHFSSSEVIHNIAKKFDLDNERNIPTVYTGILLGCSAFVAMLSTQLSKKLRDKIIWLSMAALYFYLAFDEILVIHESFAEPIRDKLSISDGHLFYHAWIIPAIGITLAIGLATYFLRIKKQISSHQKQILFLTIGLATGVIMLEAIGTQLYFSPLIYKLGPVLLEEMLEITLISLILYRLTQGLFSERSKRP